MRKIYDTNWNKMDKKMLIYVIKMPFISNNKIFHSHGKTKKKDIFVVC